MALLDGIPISEEQCIGDSLPIINNAFLSLSGNLELSAANLSNTIDLTSSSLTNSLTITSTNLLNLIKSLSALDFDRDTNLLSQLTGLDLAAKVQVVNTSAVAISAAHNNTILCLNSNLNTIVSRVSSSPFKAGHKTTFIQTGSASNITFVGFNSHKSHARLAGRFAVAEATYANDANIPFRGWNLAGNLIPVAPAGFPFSLTALPSPGAQDSQNQIALTGPRPDVIYYYADPLANIEPGIMNIFVNGYYRSTCEFTVERIGTRFGYRVAGFQPFTTGPQATGVFTSNVPADEKTNVYLTIPGFNGEPTYLSLSSTTTPGNFDLKNDIDITSNLAAYNGDTIFYFADPDPEGGGSTAAAYVFLSATSGGYIVDPLAPANTGVTSEGRPLSAMRHIVTMDEGRIGQLIGFKRAGVVGGPEKTITVPSFVGPDFDLVFTVNTGPRPSPTPSRTPGPTVPPPTPTPPTPTPTPTPTEGPARVSLIANTTPGNDDLIHSISFVSDAAQYNDTIFYQAQTLNDLELEDPMLVYVNNVFRTTVVFPNDFTGQQFGYTLKGQGNVPQVYGTFAPGRVNLFIAGEVNLTASVPPGQSDLNNGITFISEAAAYNDTITYSALTLEDLEMEDPMLIYVNGILRTTVTFPNDFTGKQFGYRLKGAQTNRPQVYSNFAPGRVDLTISDRIVLSSVITPGTEDPTHGINFIAESGALSGDKLFYYGVTLQDYEMEDPMIVYVNGTRRSSVTFPNDFSGKQFGYNVNNSSEPQVYGNFTPGRVDLTIATQPTPVPQPTPTPTPIPPRFTLRASNVNGGNQDNVNLIGFSSTQSVYNDFISYYGMDYLDMEPAFPMQITLSGALRTTIDFPNDRDGTEFLYRVSGILSGGAIPGTATLTFSAGTTFDLSATNIGTLSLCALSSTITSNTTDFITISANTASTSGDRIHFYIDNSIVSPTYVDTPMLVYVNNTLRSSVNFIEERVSTPFGYSISPVTSAQKFALFKTGRVDLTIP